MKKQTKNRIFIISLVVVLAFLGIRFLSIGMGDNFIYFKNISDISISSTNSINENEWSFLQYDCKGDSGNYHYIYNKPFSSVDLSSLCTIYRYYGDFISTNATSENGVYTISAQADGINVPYNQPSNPTNAIMIKINNDIDSSILNSLSFDFNAMSTYFGDGYTSRGYYGIFLSNGNDIELIPIQQINGNKMGKLTLTKSGSQFILNYLDQNKQITIPNSNYSIVLYIHNDDSTNGAVSSMLRVNNIQVSSTKSTVTFTSTPTPQTTTQISVPTQNTQPAITNPQTKPTQSNWEYYSVIILGAVIVFFLIVYLRRKK